MARMAASSNQIFSRSRIRVARQAATASIQVDYESLSLFSREHSRRFGAPLPWDITQLRQMGADG